MHVYFKQKSCIMLMLNSMIILGSSLSLAPEPATSDTRGKLLEIQMLVSLPTPIKLRL